MRQTLILLVIALFLFGCGGKKTMSPAVSHDRNLSQEESLKKSRDALQEEQDRLIISNASLKLQAEEPESVHNDIMTIAYKYGGFVTSSSDNTTTIRVPAISFQSALADIALLGEILDKQVFGRDVTEEFKDLDIRIENAEKTRQRYLALLDKATTISDILMLERELDRLNREIELLKGQRERLSNQIAFATITVKTIEKTKPGPIGRVFSGLYKGVKWLVVWD